MDAIHFSGGKALDNRICGQSFFKIKSTQIVIINTIRKLAKTTQLFKLYGKTMATLTSEWVRNIRWKLLSERILHRHLAAKTLQILFPE